MNIDSIRIILVATTHPGNIGSTARAMKTMGLKSLYLASPSCSIDGQSFAMAAGANDVLNEAVVTESLSVALRGCHLVFASSARPRDIALPGMSPDGCADYIKSQVAENRQIAIVFGREHAGLTNDELLQCHYHVTIPSNPDFSSLNLSQAVQVMVYEIRKRFLDKNSEPNIESVQLAAVDEVENFYDHLKSVMVAIDFLDLASPKRLMQRLRRLFNRTQLEQTEVNILRGILTSMQKKLEDKHKE